MAVKLNLLSEEATLTGPSAQIVKTIRPLNVILLAAFIITVLGMGGFFIFSSISLNSLNAGNSSLESQIQTQSSAQQQIVLLKDRLGKIKTVQGISGASKNLTNMDLVLGALTGNTILSELDVSSTKTAANLLFKSNSDLTNFVKSVSANTTFAQVTVGTFSYSSSGGYQVSLSFAENKIMQKITGAQMALLKAILPFFVVVILFVIVGQFGFGKISEIRGQISSAQADQNTLSQKLDILRNVSVNGAASSNLVTAALPDSNSTLEVMSQLKNLAGANGLTLSELKGGAAAVDPTGLSVAPVSFNAAGPRDKIEAFIKGVSGLAPISIVDQIKITQNDPATALAAITVKAYWAPFPTKVPAVTDAITDLTPAEQQTLQTLSSLSQPSFSAVTPAQGGKSDPFSP